MCSSVHCFGLVLSILVFKYYLLKELTYNIILVSGIHFSDLIFYTTQNDHHKLLASFTTQSYYYIIGNISYAVHPYSLFYNWKFMSLIPLPLFAHFTLQSLCSGNC